MIEPGQVDRVRRKNCYRKVDGKCLDILFGRLKTTKKWGIQAYRYPHPTWTTSAARAHCKRKGGKFEAIAKKD